MKLKDGKYSVNRLFTSEEWISDCIIVVENGLIAQIITEQAEKINVVVDAHYGCLIPSFIDIQIYGAGGKLFCEYPDVDALNRLHDYCAEGGADYFLPTVATNTLEVFYACIDAVRQYWESGGEGCLGIHLEGPWLSVAKRGAHTASLVHSPTSEEAREVLKYGKGVIKMITVAPEVCSPEVLDLIHSYGVVLSAGHSNASYSEATNAFDNSHITTCTHLYNCMSGLQHRAPGLVGAIFNHPTVRSSVVPDGYHVDWAAIEIAKKVMGRRLFVITDAVTSTTTGEYPHVLVGDKYESNGVLSGSALTMRRAVLNLSTFCRNTINLEEAIRMCSLYPAGALGLSSIGKIAMGHEASLIEWY